MSNQANAETRAVLKEIREILESTLAILNGAKKTQNVTRE
jgi:hypothetical protein